jgi:hypothetical protein
MIDVQVREMSMDEPPGEEQMTCGRIGLSNDNFHFKKTDLSEVESIGAWYLEASQKGLELGVRWWMRTNEGCIQHVDGQSSVLG